MTAITTPRATPMIMARMVTSSDVRTPSMTGGRNMLSNMKPHWNAGLVTSMWTNIATRTAMTTMATQRPGWRTGTALTVSGGTRSGVLVAVSVMAPAPFDRTSGVDGRVVDRPRVHAPLGEDPLVGAVVDQGLDRIGDGLGEVALLLLDDVAVGGGVVDVAEQLELAVGLLDGVGEHRGVGQHGVVLARDDRGRGLVLALVAVDGDGRLAVGLALVLAGGGEVVGVLDGVGLDGDLLAAGVVGLDPARVALLGAPLGTGVEVADHVDLLLALVVDGERRDTHLVLAGLEARDDRVEHGRLVFGLEAELGRDGVEQVDVEADDRLAVGVQELVRRIGRVGPDQELAVGLDRVRHLRGECLVDRRGRAGGGPGAPAARVLLVAAARRHQGDDQHQTEERPVAPPACLHGFPPRLSHPADPL